MQDLRDFIPTFPDYLKSLMRDGSKLTSMLSHPRIDGGTASKSAV